MFCETRIGELGDVQLGLLEGAPVTIGGVVMDCPTQCAQLGVMAAKGVLDGLKAYAESCEGLSLIQTKYGCWIWIAVQSCE